MQLGTYITWPVQKDWRGNPCATAPASAACRSFKHDVRLEEYGLGRCQCSGPGCSCPGLGHNNGGSPLIFLAPVILALGVWWLLR